MGNENERTKPLLGFDVGLGLKMQLQQPTSYSFGGNNTSSDYERSYASAFPTSSSYTTAHPFSSGLILGKGIFTASQWQELERQKMIHKYMMASVPVPPQLLLSVHTTPSLVSPSSNRSPNLDLRFSSSSSSLSGSDPEPWRCKRTDGKKWRCSRDVLPDQKYCERHAHKSRSRSRKHVEVNTTLSPQNNSTSSDRATYACSSHHQQQQPLMFPSINASNNNTKNAYTTMASSATSYNDHTSCIEWFMRGDSISSYSRKTNDPVSTRNQQQWQQLINQTSSSSSSLDNNPNKNSNASSALMYNQPNEYEEKRQEQVGFVSLNHPYNHHQTTRHFIDAWENEGKKFEQQQPPLSSLSLSMLSGARDNDLNIGTVNSDRDSDGILRTTEQWLSASPITTWMNTNYSPTPPVPLPPGGPLGEALCLGNAITTRCSTNPVASQSPHGGHSFSSNNTSNNNNNSSSCSKSSCDEDGSHGLNFIGR